MKHDSEDRIAAKMRRQGIEKGVIEGFIQKVRKAKTQEAFVSMSEVVSPGPTMLLNGRKYLNSQKEPFNDELLKKLVVIKLNGGLSTTMGGRIPKCVLTAKNGLSYLEIVLAQIEALSRKIEIDIPLVLMNSFFTHASTMEIVNRRKAKALTLLQSQTPRLLRNDFSPLNTGTDDDWSPPGHGDLFDSLKRSKMLEDLLDKGYKWAFVSNLDNLAAYPESWVLDLMDESDVDFILEVTDRTNEDKKGGAPVVRNGLLELLEIAQVSPSDRMIFQDIYRFPYFNTNNLWVNLEALSHLLSAGPMDLPIIQNYKNVQSQDIVQLETAMGAALGCFKKSKVLKVSRDRFFPTKKISDLFVLQSDACALDSMARLRRNGSRPNYLPSLPRVFFSEDFLNSPLDLENRFQNSTTVSLVRTDTLDIYGAVFFESDVTVVGRVEIRGGSEESYRIPSGTVLKEGRYPPRAHGHVSGRDGDPELYPLELSRMAILKPWGSQSVPLVTSRDMENLPSIGELWETFDGPEEGSFILNGVHRLKSLRELIRELGPSLIGSDLTKYCHEPFPLLIKYLFPSKALSIQVHPDDRYAAAHDNSLGKTEMWVILNAAQDSYIMVGWRPNLDKETILNLIQAQDFNSAVNTVVPKAGEIYFIPPGTVHALGPGVSVLEIQQNSDITYRIYDWDRVDENGSKRSLHTEKALEVINFDYVPDYRVRPCETRIDSSIISYLCACNHFAACRWIFRDRAHLESDPSRFWVLNVVAGQGHLHWVHGDPIWIEPGTTLLIPAELGKFSIQPTGYINIIKSWLPDMAKDVIIPLKAEGFSNDQIIDVCRDHGLAFTLNE
jgi:UTP--glucose-1-phosphate uridylyltransferase